MSNENIVEELRECAAHAGGEGYTYNVMRRAAAEIKRLRTDHGVVAHAHLLRAQQAEKERDALAAELEAARKQEPVGEVVVRQTEYGTVVEGVLLGSFAINADPGDKLYALPPLAGQVAVPLSCDQILMVFEENGFRIEPGETFSAKGQIAQLLNAVGVLLAGQQAEVKP